MWHAFTSNLDRKAKQYLWLRSSQRFVSLAPKQSCWAAWSCVTCGPLLSCIMPANVRQRPAYILCHSITAFFIWPEGLKYVPQKRKVPVVR